MGSRISKVVTATGDDGFTGLSDGRRLAKHEPRIQCLGDIDELNAQLGLLISTLDQNDWKDWLLRIQHDLFDLGAELSLVNESLINAPYITFLESCIETLSNGLAPLKEFILPGGSPSIAQCHVARTVCRRAERSLSGLASIDSVNPSSLVYLNRLSDCFFVLGRALAAQDGQRETYWQSSYSRVKPAR